MITKVQVMLYELKHDFNPTGQHIVFDAGTRFVKLQDKFWKIFYGIEEGQYTVFLDREVDFNLLQHFLRVEDPNANIKLYQP